ncbi:Stress responsive A/B Barrel Domain protein [Rubripirellula tenax]|uniref:Stress responsive A/B Barrel Domain protein n=1 Tax=Rubripirellula tenax TaxID=2528015 RepID=A0A5C6FIC9_9BACT|nr:Dabb family protein [Rubripirellula tenax]TWU60565.1 Stress responsive A/B Barrel Domain protein [Rubripirellula tenax]
MNRLYRRLVCLSASLVAASMCVGTDAGAADGDGKVLRHAVFFAFKDSSTKEDVDGVVKAFEALPTKIDSIKGFQWGTNNSPEDHDDGFTHAFVLTFADEAGRAEYLPHPEHAAFGGVLRPHMKEVFVVDYWATPSAAPLEKELKHAVFFKFKDDAPVAEIHAVETAFAQLPSKIDSIKAFEWGVNNSPEKHDDGFTHAFMVTFDSEEGRAAYLPHADHEAFVEVLLPVLDKVRVIDFWAE